MVHGTADDNVHYQQSMMFSRALEEADVLFRSVENILQHFLCNEIFITKYFCSFRQISYPDEAHGLVGLRPHFYHTLTDFLINDCFGRNEVVRG